MRQHIPTKGFFLYACLPFIEIAHENVVELGPVLFWPASRADEFLDEDLCLSFYDYLKTAGHIKAEGMREEVPWVSETGELVPSRMTCVSLKRDIPDEQRESLLIDSLYLLYFVCNFRGLYYGHEILPLSSFQKMIPALPEFIGSKTNWEERFIQETDREKTACLHLVDPDVCRSLGKALEIIYISKPGENTLNVQKYKRIVRSIRLVVDRFFERFVNLFAEGISLSKSLFNPEDMLFLSLGFETLFDLTEKNPEADLKNQLRSMLHLRYSTPVELFWKWVDDFYQAKRRILNGEPYFDPVFRGNPNFEISHLSMGIKVFVYAVYCELFHLHLVKGSNKQPYIPVDFKWIHPEEIIIYWWTESTLLHKLAFLFQKEESNEIQSEVNEEIRFFSNLFVAMVGRYISGYEEKGEGIARFFPLPVEKLMKDGKFLVEKLQAYQGDSIPKEILSHIHPEFLDALKKRLNEKRQAP